MSADQDIVPLYNNLAILIIRGLALFQFFGLWPSIGMAAGMAHAEMPDGMKLVYYLTSFLYLAFSVLLWLCAPWLAEKMNKGVSGSAGKYPGLSFDDIFITATVAVGLLILGDAIPFVGSFIQSVAEMPEKLKTGENSGWGRMELTAPLYIVLAVLLIFTPDGLLRIVRFTHKAGSVTTRGSE